MHKITLIADVSSVLVFLWLIYKVACTGLATPGRCRLLHGLRLELQDQSVRLAAELERLAGQVRKRMITDPAAALRKFPDGEGAAAEAGIPAEYRPAGLLQRIAAACLAGDAELAWDEHRHWLQRISFGWSARLAHGKQAKEFGLLFTVIGALLAFAHLSQVSKPFEVFGALSLAMVTTIVGLLLSLFVSHCLVQRFYIQYRQLQIESEEVVLTVLRHAGRLRALARPGRQQAARRLKPPNSNGKVLLPILGDGTSPLVLYADTPPGGNGGVRCVKK
jgi:hypothetical protein